MGDQNDYELALSMFRSSSRVPYTIIELIGRRGRAAIVPELSDRVIAVSGSTCCNPLHADPFSLSGYRDTLGPTEGEYNICRTPDGKQTKPLYLDRLRMSRLPQIGVCYTTSEARTSIETSTGTRHRICLRKTTSVVNEGSIIKAMERHGAFGFTRKICLTNVGRTARDSAPLTVRSVCTLNAGAGAIVYLLHNAEYCELKYSGNPAVERKPWFDAVKAEGNWSAGIPLNQTLGRMMLYSPALQMLTYLMHSTTSESKYAGCPTKASSNGAFIELEAESPLLVCKPGESATVRTRVWFMRMRSPPADALVQLLGKGRDGA